MYIKIPFQIRKGQIETENDIKHSIDGFVELIVSSYWKSFKPESDFGFGFKNFKFEIFDEINGTIMNKKANDKFYNNPGGKRITDKRSDNNYSKKINETSKNSNSFAYDLKNTIEKYENRLKDVYVDMKHDTREKMIILQIKGKLYNEKANDYTHEISFQVW